MSNPFIRKLAHGAALTDADRALLVEVCARTRQFGPRQDLIREGDRPSHVHVVLAGLACRYKVLADGARQITDYLVPGDACHLHTAILEEADHSVATLTACTIAEVGHEAIEALVAGSSRIARALWWTSLVSEATAREWVVNVGQREAPQRMAHLFCELHARLQAVGLAETDGYEWPVTQDELADTLGITAVHVNRVLQDLRKAELVALRSRRLTIPDLERLRAFAGFRPNYLHLTRPDAGRGATGTAAQGGSDQHAG